MISIPTYLLSSNGCERKDELCQGCNEAVKQSPETGRWFITMGHAGFNSRLNNLGGYTQKVDAKNAMLRYLAAGRKVAVGGFGKTHIDEMTEAGYDKLGDGWV
jgi:hypothetical protein